MLFMVKNDIFNTNCITRATRRTENDIIVVWLYFSASDDQKQVSKSFKGNVADKIWNILEQEAQDLSD